MIARQDDYFFGVLHSKAHELWARGQGTQLREASSGQRYTLSTTFETFPFPWPPGQEPKDDPRLWVAWGFPVGIVSGLIGLGGGILMIPILTIALKFNMHRAVGTSLAVMMFSGAAGALGYLINGLDVSGLPAYSTGYINWIAWGSLAVTSIAMAQVGARTAHMLPAKWLRLIFIAVMVYMGLRMIGAVP